MPIVRLSGKVLGKTDPQRKERAELLYHLFANGWDIYNGNGDQTIHLENIQEKIVESDAFVFTHNPTLEDYFNLTSIFVGFQTLDDELNGKPAVIINNDNSWDNFLNMMDHLHALGTVKERYNKYISVVNSVEAVVSLLEKKHATIDPRANVRAKEPAPKEPDVIEAGTIINNKEFKMPERNICVFCSASISKQEYLDEGYEMGRQLAKRGLGCISGAGKTGIMGQVVKGAYENKGWSGGSNVPHIIRLEGLPEGLNEFWPRADIYTRMEVMIDNSDAFVIMPGGMGTIQELLAMLILKQNGDDLMRDKKIILYNKHDKDTGRKFWAPVVEIIKTQNSFIKELEIVESLPQIFEKLD